MIKNKGTGMCNSPGESIEHITAGCPSLSQSEYLSRHNEVAKIIHRHLAIKYKLVTNPPPFYKYSPNVVLESKDTVMYWDRPVLTDRTVDYNRPDIVLVNKKEKTALIIDISCPLSTNLQKTEAEKIRKYQNLCIDMKLTWQLSEVRVVPVVISVTGVVTEKLKTSLEKLNLPQTLIKHLQRTTIMQTCHIVRKFLNVL